MSEESESIPEFEITPDMKEYWVIRAGETMNSLIALQDKYINLQETLYTRLEIAHDRLTTIIKQRNTIKDLEKTIKQLKKEQSK